MHQWTGSSLAQVMACSGLFILKHVSKLGQHLFGLLLHSTKPLLNSRLNYQECEVAFTRGWFHRKWQRHPSLKCVWNFQSSKLYQISSIQSHPLENNDFILPWVTAVIDSGTYSILPYKLVATYVFVFLSFEMQYLCEVWSSLHWAHVLEEAQY